MPAAYFEAGSLVFHMTDGPIDLRDFRRWWKFIPGACWRHPEGPKSTIEDRLDHPVVQVSLPDALAYAEWAGRSLPGERQWEFAARSTSDEEYSWGAALNEGDEIHANTWLGSFPFQNDRTETAPFTQSVSAYDPNAHGLYNMIGNVWEWTIDAFQNAHDPGVNCCTPSRTIEPGKNYVTKGGSFLCAGAIGHLPVRLRKRIPRPTIWGFAALVVPIWIDAGVGHSRKTFAPSTVGSGCATSG